MNLNFVGKVKGLNLTAKPGAPMERAYWLEWDWDGWIRPQLDCAVALGCNTIRILGDVAMVLNGQMSQATYNARWTQLANYCQANGLAVHYTGCATYDVNGVDNGNMADMADFKGKIRKASHGMCLAMVQSTASGGQIRVTATSPGLKPATVMIVAKS